MKQIYRFLGVSLLLIAFLGASPGTGIFSLNQISLFLSELRVAKVGDQKKVDPQLPVDIGNYATGWAASDSNNDGLIDYAVLNERSGLMLFEVNDFNADGKMDDFLFFSQGQPLYREIDSNYDGKVDVWLHIFKGKYLQAYEKDSNFDGILDKVKVY